MRLMPLSKSTKNEFDLCPMRAEAFKNLGYESETGQAAMDGVEFHDLFAGVITHRYTFAEALQQASNFEVEAFLVQARQNFGIPDLQDALVERYVAADYNGGILHGGDRENPPQAAAVHGLLDYAVVKDGTLWVRDWKTGRWQKDSVFERHQYAGVLGKALYPDVRKVVFDLCFIRTGDVMRSTYQWSRDDRTVTVTDPTGESVLMRGAYNPILIVIQDALNDILDTDAVPRPGKHCKRLFGKQCQFYQRECPDGFELQRRKD